MIFSMASLRYCWCERIEAGLLGSAGDQSREDRRKQPSILGHMPTSFSDKQFC